MIRYWRSRHWRPAALLAAAIAAASSAARASPVPHYAGSQVCAQCHQSQYQAWLGSHHALAMQPATAAAVLAPFGGETFAAAGIASTFSRNDGKFYVRTDGPEESRRYQIAGTLGVAPLQQYLVAKSNGGMQVLGIAWDTRPKARGGQRWFQLSGESIAAGDESNWIGSQQNWNFMCAECHTTQFRKNFNPQTRTYASAWLEMNVACEACHGPGSEHVAWARRAPTGIDPADSRKGLALTLDDRKGLSWTINAQTGNAARSKPPGAQGAEIEMCARCHSRRSQIGGDYVHGKPLLDTHVPSLLESGLYWDDGQIRAEVYEYASFLQSKMHQQGVTCSDCHDPHSAKLRAPGNQVCVQCHAQAKYDSVKHHFHRPGSSGARCTSCHMPATIYMSIDPRRDHSMRVPRPDASLRLGTPNACNMCHGGRTPRWAAQWTDRWYPMLRRRQLAVAEALHASDRGDPRALRLLLEVMSDSGQPAIARASAAARLPADAGRADVERVSALLTDADPLVRRAAAEALAGAPATLRARLLPRLLDDPVKGVRMAAARWLAGAPARELDAAERARLHSVLDEYIAAQQFNADRPESYNNLGTLYADQGDWARAEAALKQAIEIEPALAVSSLNLADVYRQMGREADAQALLAAVIGRDQRNAPAYYALGLSMLRQQRSDDALRALRRAARLAPENARYAYVCALALERSGQLRKAIATLEAALVRHPNDRDSLRALVRLCRRQADTVCAQRYAGQLSRAQSSLSMPSPSVEDRPR